MARVFDSADRWRLVWSSKRRDVRLRKNPLFRCDAWHAFRGTRTSSFYSVGTPPIPFIIVIVFALIFGAILTQTRFGEYALAIGGAEDKARVLGLPVKKLKILIFMLSGLMAGLGGGVLTSQLGSGSPTSGIGFELLAISAVVIGGTPLTGGMGSILGTIVGSLVISILANGMIILGISTNVQTVLTGVVLVVAVLLSIQRDKLRVIK
jgi:ribose/xylose/arabinose/galactoside ABC-type transport system permease subunit